MGQQYTHRMHKPFVNRPSREENISLFPLRLHMQIRVPTKPTTYTQVYGDCKSCQKPRQFLLLVCAGEIYFFPTAYPCIYESQPNQQPRHKYIEIANPIKKAIRSKNVGFTLKEPVSKVLGQQCKLCLTKYKQKCLGWVISPAYISVLSLIRAYN